MSAFAKVICDSISREGIRLLTFHLHYWRAIHSELMTHRDFGRNARSSRAVPSKVLLTEPIFIPQFGINQPGMQSDILAPPELQEKWGAEWEQLAFICRQYVQRWTDEKMHKQHCNRPLEWFGWIDVQVTAVYWENFFALRISEYAQPEFDELAKMMRVAMAQSTPRRLLPGEWHLPWITDEDEVMSGHDYDLLCKLSVARSARLSYKPFDGEANLEKELERYEKLVVSSPVHASPAEHQATPDVCRWGMGDRYNEKVWDYAGQHGNLYGWRQYRKMLPNENVREQWALT